MSDILRYMCLHLGMLRQIQGYSESWHSQAYSCIYCIFRTHGLFRHIQNHRHIQSVSGLMFRYYSGAIHAYFELLLGRFRHIYNLGLFRPVMFQAYPSIFTQLCILWNICLHLGIYQQIQEYSGSYWSKQWKATPALQVRFF